MHVIILVHLFKINQQLCYTFCPMEEIFEIEDGEHKKTWIPYNSELSA